MFENTIKRIDNDDELNEIENKLITDIDHKKRVVIYKMLLYLVLSFK